MCIKPGTTELSDPLDIETVNEQCGYCMDCGRIDYKANLIEMGCSPLCETIMLYLCESCLADKG